MDLDKLYDEIVAAGISEVKQIAQRIVQEPDVANGKLASMEFFVRRMMFALGSKLLKPLLERLNGGYAGNSIRCSCGCSAFFKCRRKTWVDTILGAMRIEKAYYYCSHCSRGFSPLEEMLRIHDGRTEALSRLISLAGVTEPFEEGARVLYEMAGVKASDNTVARVAEDAGRQAMERENAGDEVLTGKVWEKGGREKMYVTVDGTTAQMRGYWREFKVGAIYGNAQEQKRYYATLEGSADFMLKMRHEAIRKGITRASEVVALADGQPWIWKEFEINFPDATQILDLWHLMEHVWALSNALFGEGSGRTDRWAEDACILLKEKGGGALLKRLKKMRAAQKKRGERAETDQLIKYLANNTSRTNYPQYIERGLDIGSGPVEAACKTVIGQRLKSSGMRWTEEGAEKIARLRAIYLSGLWDKYWGFTTRAA